MSLDLSSLRKAAKSLKTAVSVATTAEIAEPRTKKDLFRIAARNGLIDNPQAWFQYNEARNLTSHTYDEGNAETVFRKAVEFVSAADRLLGELEATND